MKAAGRRESLAPATHEGKKNLQERIEQSEKRVREFLEERELEKHPSPHPNHKQ